MSILVDSSTRLVVQGITGREGKERTAAQRPRHGKAMQATDVYHVWFATKRRSWLLAGDVDTAVRRLIRDLAHEKRIQLLECETAVDHVHLLLRLSEERTLPRVMNLLKGGSSYRLHRTFPGLKLDSGSDHFWQRGYNFAVVEPGSLAARRRYVTSQKQRLDKFER